MEVDVEMKVDVDHVVMEISLVEQVLEEVVSHEAISMRGVREKVKSLKHELNQTKDIIAGPAELKLHGESLHACILKMREVACEAEDVVERFLVNEGSSRRSGLFNFKSIITKRGKTGEEIDSIRNRLSNMIASYAFKGIPQVRDTDDSRRQEVDDKSLEMSQKLLREGLDDKSLEKMVGREDDVKKLLREVLDEKGGTITVVEGMAGIGKTTLAREIFDHPDVGARFKLRVWCPVSSDKFSPRETMILLMQQLYSDEQWPRRSESNKELQEMRLKRLQREPCFIVLDNVQKVEHWEYLEAAFSDELGTGSRVLLTTCNKFIATHDRRYTHHKMKLLPPEKSWELFVMSCARYDDKFTLILEHIGREIVKRCEGLPLTICRLGGLLGNRQSTMEEWELVLNNISDYLERTGVLKMLEPSCPKFSFHLKTLVFFKEGATIPVKALLHIWFVQGLIKKDGRRTTEEIARVYLDELIDRKMLQIVDLTMEDRVKNVCLPGVLREKLLEERCKVELGLEEVNEAEEMISSSEHEPRHRVLYGGNLEKFSRSRSKYLRSIFLHNNKGEGVDVDVDDFWKSSQLLRILYLDGIKLSTFPNSLRALIWLKYLMIRRHKIHSKLALEVDDYLEPVKLPIWLDSLKLLEVLDMEGEKVEFPNDVALKMKRLRYFSAYCVLGPISINSWENMETLKYMRLDDWMKCCSTLSSSCKVRKLGLFLGLLNRADEWREVRASLESLKKLEHLQLRWNCFIPIYPQIVLNLRSLTRLKLRGKLSKCPNATIFPPNLSHLTLAFTDLSEDLMAELSKLPELCYLKLLGNAYKPERMQVLESGFPCLKVLTLKEMFHLKSINIKTGGMFHLQKLLIQQCPSLQIRNLPEHVVTERIS